MDGSPDSSGDSGATDGSLDAATDATDSATLNHDGGTETGPRDSSTDATGDATEAGQPEPVVLVSDAPNAYFLATDGRAVYWVDWVQGDAGQPVGRVMSVSIAGGGETVLATFAGASPTGLAIDGSNVYWTGSDGTLNLVPKSGGSPMQLASGVGSPLAVASGSVYYTSATTPGVWRVPVGGGTAPIQLASTGLPVDLAVVAGYVFWADEQGTIAYVSASAGGTPTNLVAPDPDAGSDEYVSNVAYQNLATDGVTLYWNRAPGSAPGAIMSVPVGGGPPQVVCNLGQSSAQSVATDGSKVYFVDVAANTVIASAPVSGGAPSTIASQYTSTANIASDPGPTLAVDSTNIYWLAPPRILKFAK